MNVCRNHLHKLPYLIENPEETKQKSLQIAIYTHIKNITSTARVFKCQKNFSSLLFLNYFGFPRRNQRTIKQRLSFVDNLASFLLEIINFPRDIRIFRFE